eukprot:TRINITY_DN7823_c0_g1_i3.p1 TRINITY_DN7823_c0_g1~~TRINITY_DN7823_c0_g1_i3.p1  ORF type:complete len:1251 (+),score=180.55 TRINITY_DN7823_c0_g1_i3:62-3754(+)
MAMRPIVERSMLLIGGVVLQLALLVAAQSDLKALQEDLRVIVRYTPTYTKEETGSHASSLKEKAGVRAVKALPNVRMAVVACDTPETVERLMLELAEEPAVENVMPDTMIYLDDQTAHLTAVSDGNSTDNDTDSMTTTIPEVYLNTSSTTTAPESDPVVIPNDPLFDQLWGMGLSQEGGIDAVKAWPRTIERGMDDIIVAVIDTGIDYTHVDLHDQMWVNPGEIPGNGIDDDGNGYIDDVHGANFITGSGSPLDDHGHGTHCAGTIAGIGNNSLGVAGVAWTGGVKLMGLKFISAANEGRISDAISALEYALANGARISSNSWGGGPSSSAMRVAIERVNAAGVLFVASAGNEHNNNDAYPHYPDSYDVENIISVAATKVSGELAWFSNYGTATVDVAAPGDQILSCAPKDSYAWMSGTSMAAPHVSGLAALIWIWKPQLSNAQVKEIIKKSSLSMPTLSDLVQTGGQVNVFDALSLTDETSAAAAPVSNAEAVTFEDTDGKLDRVNGTATIMAARSEDDVEYYKIWIVSAGGYPLLELGEVKATGASEYHFPITDLYLPAFADALMVVPGNGTGEVSPWYQTHAATTPLRDYVIPAFGPGELSWRGDTCAQAGCVEGVLTVERAADEATLTGYEVYWQITDGDEGFKPLVASFPPIGFKVPECAGMSCSGIKLERRASKTYISNSNYQNSESATITFSGPATVRLTQLSTEPRYDTLIIDGQSYSGVQEDGEVIEIQISKRTSKIEWVSDFMIADGSWALEVIQADSHARVTLPDQLPLGDRLQVVALRDKTAAETSSTVDVLDYNEEMPPSPAFAPREITWKPIDDTAAVSVELLSHTTATFVQVQFADSAGNILGENWKLDLNDEVMKCPESVKYDELHLPCQVSVPLIGFGVKKKQTEVCADVCATDGCIGNLWNEIPTGETWVNVGNRSWGCCLLPLPGWGACNRCCKVETVMEGGVRDVPAGATTLVARVGNSYGMATGKASMKIDGFTAAASFAMSSSTPEKPHLRGSALVDKVEKATQLMSASNVTLLKKISNPWLSRLGAVAFSKFRTHSSSKTKLLPNRLVGSLEIDGWQAIDEKALSSALASAVGDDAQHLCKVDVTGLTTRAAEDAEEALVTRVDFAIVPKEQLSVSGTRYSLEGASRAFLDAVEARFALLGLGGALSKEIKEKVLEAGQAAPQRTTTPDVRFGYVTQTRAVTQADARADAPLSSSSSASALPAEMYP